MKCHFSATLAAKARTVRARPSGQRSRASSTTARTTTVCLAARPSAYSARTRASAVRRPPQLAKPDVRGGEEEHGGQRVLDLGRPGDGLDAQRMQREETGREGRKPDAPRGAREQQEKQGRRRHVQRDARGVVGGGAGSVRLREHLVEQPGERVPVALVQGGQRPAQDGGAQPRRDAGLGRDEPVVVEWDEIVAQRRREGDERRERDQHRDQGQAPGGGDGSAVGPRRRDHLPEPDSEPAIGSVSKPAGKVNRSGRRMADTAAHRIESVARRLARLIRRQARYRPGRASLRRTGFAPAG